MRTTVEQDISADVLNEVVKRLVTLATPLKIILFGSNARGETHPDSDLDLLIVKKEVAEQYDEALRLDRALRDLMLPLDLVVVSEAQFKRYQGVPGTIYYRSVQEGQVLYAQ